MKSSIDDLNTVLGELCDRYGYQGVMEQLRDIASFQERKAVGRASDQWTKFKNKLTDALHSLDDADQIF